MNIDGTNTLACTKNINDVKGRYKNLSFTPYGGYKGFGSKSFHAFKQYLP